MTLEERFQIVQKSVPAGCQPPPLANHTSFVMINFEHVGSHMGPPSPTDTSENITFPHLRWWAVKN